MCRGVSGAIALLMAENLSQCVREPDKARP